MAFQNALFEDDQQRKSVVEKIGSKYLGVGEDSNYLLSFNYELMDEFRQKLSSTNYSDIFSPLLTEAKEVVQGLFHNYMSQ